MIARGIVRPTARTRRLPERECHTPERCSRDGGRGEDHLVLPTAARAHHAEQCFACGLTEGQITHRLRSGIWTEIRPSVYALAGVPPSWEQAVLAVTLSCPPAYASHATTARLSAVRGFLEVPDAIEVLTPLGRKSRLDGVIGRRSGALFDADLTFRGSDPTVTVARSIVDVSGRVTTKELGYIVDDALRRKLLRSRACGAAPSDWDRRPDDP